MTNKKAGVDFGMENLVYILIVFIFVAMIIFFIARPGTGISAYEKLYAKKIALMIDKAEPGMKIELDAYEMYLLAKESRLNDNWIRIDNEKNKVKVKFTQGSGYDFYFFNDVNVIWNLDKENKKLFMEIVENG